MSSGWIKLDRGLLDSWIWQDNDAFRIWIYILCSANYEAKKAMVGGELVTIEAGQFLTSVRKIAEAVGCSRQKASRTLGYLTMEEFCDTKPFKSGTLLSLKEYGISQLCEPQSLPQNLPQNDHQVYHEVCHAGDTTKEYKEIKKERNKEENRINNSNSKTAFGRNQNVYLTGEEIGKLIDDFGYEAAMAKIETESAWKVKKGAEIENDYSLIRKWLAGDKEKGLLEKPKPMVTEKPTEPPPEEEEEEISDEEWLKL